MGGLRGFQELAERKLESIPEGGEGGGEGSGGLDEKGHVPGSGCSVVNATILIWRDNITTRSDL